MAAKSGYVSAHVKIKKGTSIGKNPKSMATMNKAKKRSFKKYRGQGKWVSGMVERVVNKDL